MEWLAALVILACFGVGSYYKFFSDKIDAPAEQVAENVLKKYDIDKDFSAEKKKKAEQNKKDGA